jgi:endonuclease-3
VVVDTHVERLSKRFGLVEARDNVAMIERRLMALTPRERWGDLSHLLIFHGRRACKARGVKGGCGEHPICARFGVCCELRPTASPSSSIRGDR